MVYPSKRGKSTVVFLGKSLTNFSNNSFTSFVNSCLGSLTTTVIFFEILLSLSVIVIVTVPALIAVNFPFSTDTIVTSDESYSKFLF